MPQGREKADERIQRLESRRKILQRHRKVAEGMWVGGTSEHKKRLEANADLVKSIDDELAKLQSGQGRMRQRQQTIRQLTEEP